MCRPHFSSLRLRHSFVIRHSSFSPDFRLETLDRPMPTFRYQVVDAKGRTLSGSMAANDEAALELNLKKAGLWVTEVALERPLTVRTAAKASSGQHAKISGKKGRRE